jgi:hypothetical protein
MFVERPARGLRASNGCGWTREPLADVTLEV